SILAPRQWYEPLVHPRWPQNPGPTNRLHRIVLTPDEGSCLRCHGEAVPPDGRGGRFPEVSQQLSGDCDQVLKNAIHVPRPAGVYRPPGTMPPGEIDSPRYARHEEELTTACDTRPRTPVGTVINGATRAAPGSDRVDTGGILGGCTGAD